MQNFKAMKKDSNLNNANPNSTLSFKNTRNQVIRNSHNINNTNNQQQNKINYYNDSRIKFTNNNNNNNNYIGRNNNKSTNHTNTYNSSSNNYFLRNRSKNESSIINNASTNNSNSNNNNNINSNGNNLYNNSNNNINMNVNSGIINNNNNSIIMDPEKIKTLNLLYNISNKIVSIIINNQNLIQSFHPIFITQNNTAFYSLYAFNITVFDYLLRLFGMSNAENSTLVLAAFYLDRFCQYCEFHLTWNNVHK